MGSEESIGHSIGNNMDLSDKAMLVRLTISQWSARKYDKSASQEIIVNHHAKPDAGRFNKLLVNQAEIKKIEKIANTARIYHYKVTLP